MSFVNIILALLTLTKVLHGGIYTNEKRSYDKVCSVTDYGAKGDGKTNDTDAIMAAAKDCYGDKSKTGQVYFPSAHTFLTSSLQLDFDTTNCGFYINEGATLLVSNDRDAWPGSQNVIDIHSQNNFIFEGGGVFDGQGPVWWANRDDFRPLMINAHSMSGLIIKDLTVQNCPNHCLELYADSTEIYNINILNPPSENYTENITTISHNTDGIDVHGKPFYIHDSYISTGDDNVAMHENDTLIENCVFGYGHGASIGSIGSGWYTNITVNNVNFTDTETGPKIKIDSGSGPGRIWDVKFTNLNLVRASESSIIITEYYNSDENKTSKLVVDSILFENITGNQDSARKNSNYVASFLCQPSTPCTNITLRNINLQGPNDEIQCSYAQLNVDNVNPPVKSCYD